MKNLSLSMKVKIADPETFKNHLDDIIDNDHANGCQYCESQDNPEDHGYPIHEPGCAAGFFVKLRLALEGKG